jgi:hypothetical protein
MYVAKFHVSFQDPRTVAHGALFNRVHRRLWLVRMLDAKGYVTLPIIPAPVDYSG